MQRRKTCAYVGVAPRPDDAKANLARTAEDTKSKNKGDATHCWGACKDGTDLAAPLGLMVANKMKQVLTQSSVALC